MATWPDVAYKSGSLHAQRLLIGHTTKDGTAAFYSSAPLANATADQWRVAMQKRWGKQAAAYASRASEQCTS